MTETADRYRRLADGFAATIAAVPPDRWNAPSPCEDWDARDVVRHVVASQGTFLGFIGEPVGDAPAVDTEPEAAWAAASVAVQSALDDPERATRTFEGFGGETTFEAAVDRFLNFDLVVHRWDLARATGGDEAVDLADAERVLAGVAEFGDALRSPGACGPELPVADDADVTTRMLASVGRAG